MHSCPVFLVLCPRKYQRNLGIHKIPVNHFKRNCIAPPTSQPPAQPAVATLRDVKGFSALLKKTSLGNRWQCKWWDNCDHAIKYQWLTYVLYKRDLLMEASHRIQSCIVIRLGFPSTLEPRLATPAPPPAHQATNQIKTHESGIRKQQTRERGGGAGAGIGRGFHSQ